MGFDAALRIALETTAKTGSLNASLVTELSGLDAEAARLQRIGKAPIDELRPKVDALRTSVSRVRIETIEKNRDVISQYETAYLTRRDKNATAELMKQNDAKLRINAMTDSEVEALTIAYTNGADLDLPTLREMQSRARVTDELAHLVESLHTEMTDRRAEMPWITEDEKATGLADEIDLLEATPPGKVRIEADDTAFVVEVADLVDYNGELDVPA